MAPNAVMVIIDFNTDCAGTIRSWHVKDGALEEVALHILTRKSKGMNFQVRDLEKEDKSPQCNFNSMVRDALMRKVNGLDNEADSVAQEHTDTERYAQISAPPDGMCFFHCFYAS